MFSEMINFQFCFHHIHDFKKNIEYVNDSDTKFKFKDL